MEIGTFRKLGTALFLLTCAVGAATAQQGGFGGGGFGGGLGGASGGLTSLQYDRSVQAIEDEIGRYLDGKEIKNILTPGEFSEWPLDLKAGQVILAEARSDAFDPALEVVDGQGEGKHTVLASNDDRYPGDQRPLLLWRCTKDGSYSIRARCFRDKSGGQFFLRLKLFESIDFGARSSVKSKVEAESSILLRVPMKAGQIKQLLFDTQSDQRYVGYIGRIISPLGLPDAGLASRFSYALRNLIIAPVDGDYYVQMPIKQTNAEVISVSVREIVPAKVLPVNGFAVSKAPTGTPAMWAISLKKGEVLEASAPSLNPEASLYVAQAPDFGKYDLKNTEKNPFFPKVEKVGSGDNERTSYWQDQDFSTLEDRSRDNRYATFAAKNDGIVWLVAEDTGPSGGTFELKIQPALKPIEESKPNMQLAIGKFDYWSFDAKGGDIWRFELTSMGFAEQVQVLDPDFREVYSKYAGAVPGRQSWNMVMPKKGRYVVMLTSIGGGGGGTYTLRGNPLSAREIKLGSPASGNFSKSDVEVWTLTVTPQNPVILRWVSVGSYNASIYEPDGGRVSLPMVRIDEKNQYAILKVSEPKTYVFVFEKGKEPSEYLVEISPLPGLGKGN